MSNGKTTRRRVLEISIGGVVATTLLPARWIKPIVEAVVVPAHAQASPLRTTTTTRTTTVTTTPTTTGSTTATTGTGTTTATTTTSL